VPCIAIFCLWSQLRSQHGCYAQSVFECPLIYSSGHISSRILHVSFTLNITIAVFAETLETFYILFRFRKSKLHAHMPMFNVDVVWQCLGTATTNRLFLIPQVIYEYREPRWNDTDRRTEELGGGGNPVPVPLWPPQISHDMTRARIRVSEMRSPRLITWSHVDRTS
jgi:hypothetical protein